MQQTFVVCTRLLVACGLGRSLSWSLPDHCPCQQSYLRAASTVTSQNIKVAYLPAPTIT